MSCDCCHTQVGKMRDSEPFCNKTPDFYSNKISDKNTDGIVSNMDNLIANLSDIKKQIDNLESKINPVLKNIPQKENNHTSQISGGVCSLREQIDFSRTMIFEIKEKLQNLTDRVDL